jgi:pilus assembly protein CpaB
MRARTLILFLVALVLAGGTGLLVRAWLAQRTTVAEAAPVVPPPAPQKSVLVAHSPISRGQILKPADFAWQPWPEAGVGRGYIQPGTKTIEDFNGWVAREPFVAGEPISEAKVVSPGSRGFLAAVLRPGMRAVSVPVTATSGISGFVFPGDQVDILVSENIPGSGNAAAQKGAEIVLQDVRVIAVDQKLDSSKAGEALVAHNVTLEVTPKQSEVIAVASEMGKLSLSLRSLVAASAEDSAADSREDAGTLDSEISQFLRKPLKPKGNQGAPSVSILRGNGKSDTTVESQPASRGL